MKSNCYYNLMQVFLNVLDERRVGCGHTEHFVVHGFIHSHAFTTCSVCHDFMYQTYDLQIYVFNCGTEKLSVDMW